MDAKPTFFSHNLAIRAELKKGTSAISLKLENLYVSFALIANQALNIFLISKTKKP